MTTRRIPRRTRTRNPHFFRGTFGASAPTTPQFVIQDHKELPPAKYVVPAGTAAWRFPLTTSSESAEQLITTRRVVFDHNDIFRLWKNSNTGEPSTYTFSLPKEASPWITMEVAAEFVEIK